MEKINKRLLGVEDVNWDETGRGESENFTGSDGAVKVLRKINESHIPLSNDLRELFPGSTYLTHILVKLQEMCSSSGGGGGTSGGGGMSNDKVVNFSSSMSAAEIQIMIDEQEKNLGQHTLTFKFPENFYQLVSQSIVFDGFYNGKIIIDGNGSTVTDTGNIGSLFLFDVCICYIEFQNFIVQIQSSDYGIEAKATLGVFVKNCQMLGRENTFFVNAVLSDAVFDSNCAFAGGAQKITGYIYDWVKENYFSVKGGEIQGDLSVTGGVSVSGARGLTVSNNLTVKNKHIVLSVNNLSADSNNNITINISNISGLQSALDGKAASSHTHTISNISGLQSALDGKAASSHTHTISNVSGLQSALDGKLNIAGGMMTGWIDLNISGVGIRSKITNGITYLMGGTNGDTGSYIQLKGKDNGGAAAGGNIVLAATDGTLHTYLSLSPNGRLMVSGKDIVRSVDGVNADAAGNVALNALPKSGGTMTGALKFSTGAIIAGSVNTHVMGMYGGVNYNNGGGFIAYGKDYSASYGGAFVVSAHDGTTNKTLVGKPNGTLTWGGKDISLGYPNYAAGVDCGTVSSYTATTDGWIFGVQRRDAAYWNLCVNGTRAFSTGGSSWDVGTCLIPVKKGDVITTYNGWEDDDNTKAINVHMIFYPNR